MSEELEILKLVCGCLEEAGMPYMVTGSIAANFYTVPRMTRDIDIVVELREGDVGRLVEIFRDDFYIDPQAVSRAVSRRGIFNIIHNESVFKIDFIVRKDTDYRVNAFKRRQAFNVDDLKIYIISAEDLILSKLVWAKESLSELQLKDIKNLIGTVEDINTEYICKWVGRLGVEDLYNKLKYRGKAKDE